MTAIMTSKYTRKPVPVPLEVRGLNTTPLGDHVNLNPILDDGDLLSRYYMANIQKAQQAYESELNSPNSSGRSSPTIRETHSPLSNSHGGWTERSSLDSSYSLDDFDKQAANTVNQHFEDIESVLFEGSRDSSTPQPDVFKECQEWSAQFPHLRVLGKQACPSKDTGFHHVSPPGETTPRSGLSSLSPDSAELDMSYSISGSFGLSISGKSAPVGKLPTDSVSSGKSDASSSTYSSLVEEVLEEDGVYEEIIALDYKNIYEDNIEHKKQITPRRRRIGYPPVTPNACVKDSVTSAAFDHIWQEVMSWVKELVQRYASQFKATKIEIPFSPTYRDQPTPLAREFSGTFQSRYVRANTHIGNFTDRSINEILKVESKPLQDRNQGEQSDGPMLPARPGSSIFPNHHNRSVNLPRRAGRPGRLAPLVDRNRTPSEEDRGSSHQMATDALRVFGLNPTANDGVPTSPSNFHRNGALPPLEMGTQRRQHGYRATSAIDNKDMRLLSFRDRGHLAEQARPFTTHAMRSDTPVGSQNRRSSTPLGQSINARNNLHLAKSLDVRGNSLQHGVDTSHFHPDILEDQHESTLEEGIRAHWSPTPLTSSNVYRRQSNRLQMK